MRLITDKDYKEFIKTHRNVTIEKSKIPFGTKWNMDKLEPDEEYKPEGTTVWSFPDRGDWATHIGDYRGNFSPYIPRNLILKYSQKNDLILDQMVGSGTTLIECKLLQRNAIGVDINPDAIMVTRDRLAFTTNSANQESKIQTYVGDARNLNKIDDQSIDLIITHPPYSYIIAYTEDRIDGDISAFKNINEFLKAIRKIADESYRVLKYNKQCGILIGDTRKRKHYIPIAFRVMQQFLDAGFILKEDIIKLQHKVSTNRNRWRGTYYPFYKIMHEHIFIFRKPTKNEKISDFKASIRWW
ncbi:TRM11 family SAM-dependent methyltransferase [[Eubacterium] cellulosolvens]